MVSDVLQLPPPQQPPLSPSTTAHQKPCGLFHFENSEDGAIVECTGKSLSREKSRAGLSSSQFLAEARQQECRAGQAHACKIFAYLESVFIVDL